MGNLAAETGVSALLIYLLARALPAPVDKRPQRLLLHLHDPLPDPMIVASF